MPRLRLFFAALLVLPPALASADEWASYGTISAEPTAGYICFGNSNGKDITCDSTAPYIDTATNNRVVFSRSVAISEANGGGSFVLLDTERCKSDGAGGSDPLGYCEGLGRVAGTLGGDRLVIGYAMDFDGGIQFGGTNANTTALMFLAPSGGLKIGGGLPDASALLDVGSTTKGFLPPRLTTAQRDAISSPATGLTVYNTTTDALNLYTGSAWASLAPTSPAGSSGQIQFNSSGAFGADSNLFWDNANKRLGIGTAAPGSTLDVFASGTGSAVPNFPALRIRNTNPTAGDNATTHNHAALQVQAGNGAVIGELLTVNNLSSSVSLRTRGTYPLVLSTDSAERMRIDSAGNVGIGTTAPGEKLQVSGNIKVAGTIQTADSSATCSVAADRGKFRYNTATGKFQICK